MRVPGEYFLHDTFEHLSATAEAERQKFTFTPQAGRDTQWEEHIKIGGLHEFDLIGALRWRDIHEQVHWLAPGRTRHAVGGIHQ